MLQHHYGDPTLTEFELGFATQKRLTGACGQDCRIVDSSSTEPRRGDITCKREL